MRKSLVLVAGFAVIAAGISIPSAVASQPEATSAVADAPVYLVFAEKALTPPLSAHLRVLQRTADRRGTPVVIAATSGSQLASLDDLLPGFGHKLADGSPSGSFVSFDSEREAREFVASHDSSVATAARPTYSIDQQSTVKPLLGKPEASKIYDTIKLLSTKWSNRMAFTNNAAQAAQWLKGQYEELSRGKSYASTEFYNGCNNCGSPVVMHTITGSTKPQEYVVIGGHYDSTVRGRRASEGTVAPGADDNASSQGTLLETLRVLHQANWRPERTVVFFSYPGEEIGLRGSVAASQWFKSQNKVVVAHMGIDMTNYWPSKRERDITIVADNSDPALNQHFRNLIREYAPQWKAGDWECGYQCSDHAPWTNAGYPSGMISEPSINPKLHSPDDTLASMGNTAEPSVKFAQIALAYVVETAKTGK